MKYAYLILLVFACFAVSAQDDNGTYFSSLIVENPDLFVPLSIVNSIDEASFFIGKTKVDVNTMDDEIVKYCKSNSKIYEHFKNNEDANVKLLVNIEKGISYKELLRLNWRLGYLLLDSVTVAISSEDGKTFGFTRFNHVDFDETHRYFMKRYDLTSYSMSAYPFRKRILEDKKKEKNNKKAPDFLPPPPPPLPPALPIKYLFDQIPEFAPVIIGMNEKGKLTIDNNNVNEKDFDVVLKNVIQEIKDGHRPKTSVRNFFTSEEVDIFIYLSIDEEMKVEDYLAFKYRVFNICEEAGIKSIIEESFPYETDLIRKALKQK